MAAVRMVKVFGIIVFTVGVVLLMAGSCGYFAFGEMNRQAVAEEQGLAYRGWGEPTKRQAAMFDDVIRRMDQSRARQRKAKSLCLPGGITLALGASLWIAAVVGGRREDSPP